MSGPCRVPVRSPWDPGTETVRGGQTPYALGDVPCGRLEADHGPQHDRCTCSDKRLVHPEGGRCAKCYPLCAGFSLDPTGLDHEYDATEPPPLPGAPRRRRFCDA